jgi:hypothetical protein
LELTAFSMMFFVGYIGAPPTMTDTSARAPVATTAESGNVAATANPAAAMPKQIFFIDIELSNGAPACAGLVEIRNAVSIVSKA